MNNVQFCCAEIPIANGVFSLSVCVRAGCVYEGRILLLLAVYIIFSFLLVRNRCVIHSVVHSRSNDCSTKCWLRQDQPWDQVFPDPLWLVNDGLWYWVFHVIV